MFKRWHFPLHFYPFLFTLYAILYYFQHNLPTLGGTFLQVVLISFLALFLIGLLFLLLVPNRDKASLLTLLVALFFFSYGHLYDVVMTHFAWLAIKWDDRAIVLFIILLAILTALSRRSRPLPTFILPLLTVSLASLVLITSFSLFRNLPNTTPLTNSTSSKNKPDIYYLIFDDYASLPALQSIYHFDNTSFINQLQSRGFYVANKSTSNYNGSLHSIASSLNLDYLPTSSSSQSDQLLYNLTEHNQLFEQLNSQGYDTYQIGSWFSFTRTSTSAKHTLIPPFKLSQLSLYTRLFFLETTALRPLEDRYFPAIHQEFAQAEIKSLTTTIGNSEHPKAVFVHFLLPHGPYVFSANCQTLSQSDLSKDGYRNQLQCTNQKILQVIDTLLHTSSTQPIIVVQSDEGSDSYSSEEENTNNWSNEALTEKFFILNAYYFPDRNYQALYPTITPVNSFRLIFNQYLNGHYALLPDKNYIIPDYTQLNNPSEVTSQLIPLLTRNFRPSS